MKILITSGGTKIKIDLVRSITNMSRGTFGAKICDSFLTAMNPHEDEMVFFHAKDSKMPTENGYGPFEENRWIKPVRYIEYDTFDSYREKLTDLLKKEKFDIIVLAAAVSDYGVKEVFNGKYRSREDEMTIQLVKLPKVITEVRELAPESVICGFKLLVNSTDKELMEAIQKQFDENGIDLCVGNDLRDIKNNNHRLTIVEDKKYGGSKSIYTKNESECELSDIVCKHCIDVYNKKNHN